MAIKKEELKILWPFYLDAFVLKLFNFFPVFLVLYFHELNLSFFRIGILIASAPLLALIFEIPTGAISDVLGRKLSVLLGYLTETGIIIGIYFARDYYLLLIMFSLWGIATTLSSGSKEAWAVDLVEKKSRDLVHGYFHKIKFLEGLGWIFSGIIGAFLVNKFGLQIIWPFTAASFFIAFLVLTFANEDYKKRKVKIKKTLRELHDQIIISFKYSVRHHVLFYSFIATFIFVIAASFSGGLTWIPYLTEMNFPKHYFGYLWSLIAIATMITPIFSSKFLQSGKEKRFIITSLILSFFAGLLVLLPKEWIFGLSVIVALEFFIQLRAPASRIYFHRFVPSRYRSTIGSMRTMIISVGLIISFPLIGYLVDHVGARISLLMYSILIIPVVLVFLKINENKVLNKRIDEEIIDEINIREKIRNINDAKTTAVKISGDQIND